MAKRFHFSLQRVLEYREQLEEQAKLALAKSQADYRGQVGVVERLRKRLEEHTASTGGQASANADSMWLWRNYRNGLVQDLGEAETVMLQLAQVLNKARREAVARSKERKLLEKLKTNQLLRHEEEQKFEEQKEFDEMATIRYGREAL